jgi:chromosome segregation ATPase
MSAAFFMELQKLKEGFESTTSKLDALNARLDAAVARIEEVDGDRKSLRKEVREFGAKLETLHALRESIAKDAREILGATRDVIDPTTVQMPAVLKKLGHGREAT